MTDSRGYVTLMISFTPKTLARLEPAVFQMAEDELDDDQVRSELANFACELRSQLQHVVEQGRRGKTRS